MAYWQISYFDESGYVRKLPSLKAESREQAIQLSGLSKRTIDQVRVDYFGGIKAALLDRKFPVVDQVVMLSSICSKIESGWPASRAIEESVPYARIGITKAQMDICEKPKDYFTLLRFSDTVVMLAETGDKTGKLSQSLERASRTMLEKLEAEAEYRKTLIKGLAYTGLGLGFIVLVPYIGGTTLTDFIEVQRLPLTLNTTSHIMLALSDFYHAYGIPTLAILGGLYATRDRYWDAVKNSWPILHINEQLKITRAINFVSNYQILSFSGFSNQQAFQFLQERSSGRTQKLFLQALERTREGGALSSSLDHEDWPELMKQNLKGFEDANLKDREKILSNLLKALKIHYGQASSKVSRMASVFGFAAMTVAIILMSVGFYLPLVGMSQGIRGY
ncbi:type II secretion system F family protein [Pseudomonas sp. NCHU5208]|uniref:type II secretion system F family protein n=1 Tax=unclassified Pseudomonas TaxID=196821 RepID=UPI003F9D2749